MITKRIIPCLDVRDGRVVKGVNFEGVRDVADPVEMARMYNAAGADELVFYDITASFEGRALFTDILTRVAQEVFIPLTVGGGINTLADFDRVLKCGADKVSVNSGALRMLCILLYTERSVYLCKSISTAGAASRAACVKPPARRCSASQTTASPRCTTSRRTAQSRPPRRRRRTPARSRSSTPRDNIVLIV